jgi:hypothetical protein
VLYDCLSKTQHFAKIYIEILSVMSALCRLDNRFAFFKALKKTPINGGLTDEGPKVAEYPGR